MRGHPGGAAGLGGSSLPRPSTDRCRPCGQQNFGRTDGGMLGRAMRPRQGQSWLLIPLLLQLIGIQAGTGLEHIGYVPRLSSATLAGKLTQSTFTLDQPLGQFNHLNISDLDPIWLVVAHSNAIRNFTAPWHTEDIPAPSDFPQRGYYLTLRANRKLYSGSVQGSNQLPVLRVGNDTRCSPTKRGCNRPLPGSGPYRVKFLVMSKKGLVAETEWSKETRLQQGIASCPRAPECRHSGHHCHPVGPAGHPPGCPPHPAHTHLLPKLQKRPHFEPRGAVEHGKIQHPPHGQPFGCGGLLSHSRGTQVPLGLLPGPGCRTPKLLEP
ncbi:uroplakin-3b-like protein 1 isoform X1 [Sciurus carolinensis]|uniref:uroplakin-3b-like protein 1 isoform X1 n=1 Tax=Sciurus carolinensis TaxID=30640 RepID=UPI001FB51D06|nr:uroplakin-3b-like protein 1 isoform X1 [Sciurus carolinensis]